MIRYSNCRLKCRTFGNWTAFSHLDIKLLVCYLELSLKDNSWDLITDCEWSKRGWFANGPDFKWDLNSLWVQFLEIQTKNI